MTPPTLSLREWMGMLALACGVASGCANAREDGPAETTTLDASVTGVDVEEDARASEPTPLGPLVDAGVDAFAPTADLDARVERADADSASPTTKPSAQDDAGSASPGIVQGNVDYIFPDESLTDWVSYVEQLSLVTVLDEAVIPPPAQVTQRGEGYVGRKVTLRIDDTIWLNEGAVEKTGDVQLVVFGWVLRMGERFETGPERAPRIVPGGRYLLPLLRLEDSLGLLTARSVMAMPGDPKATQDIATRGQNEVARSLSTKTLEEIPALLAMTPRDPRALRYWQLPPLERVRAVQNARR